MLELILKSTYFILPAYFANMFPVFAASLNLPLGQPISKKQLGDHKTWRGFYSGYLGALLVLYFQKEIFVTDYALLDYQNINLFLYAFLFGIGSLTGDSIKSFFKRRLKMKPGKAWFPFDQIDFILGVTIFLAPFYLISWQVFLTLLLLTPIVHFTANIIGYALGLKKVWW